MLHPKLSSLRNDRSMNVSFPPRAVFLLRKDMTIAVYKILSNIFAFILIYGRTSLILWVLTLFWNRATYLHYQATP